MFEEEVSCGICGTKSTQTKIASTNVFGSPDLDTRPPEMARSTIYHKIQRCPSCGYCASDISTYSSSAKHIIESPDYQTCVYNESMPAVGASFMALSYEKQQMKEYADSVWAAIHAAWICDDAKSDAAARDCRLRAVSMIEKGKEVSQTIADHPGTSEAITVDLMRRAGMFQEAVALAEKTVTRDIEEIIKQVLTFEIELIAKKDIEAHTVSEIMSDNEPNNM